MAVVADPPVATSRVVNKEPENQTSFWSQNRYWITFVGAAAIFVWFFSKLIEKVYQRI